MRDECCEVCWGDINPRLLVVGQGREELLGLALCLSLLRVCSTSSASGLRKKMVRSGVLCPGPSWGRLGLVASLLLPLVICSAQQTEFQELVRINVTSLQKNQTLIEQISFNISYTRGLVNLNGFPLSKGVSRMSCRMEITEYGTLYEQPQLVREAVVILRVLVLHWPINNSSGEASIIVQQEVISIDRSQVNQNETMEVKLIVNEAMEVLQHTCSPVILKGSWIHSTPWNSDALITFPNIPQSAGDSVPQDTTREYNIKQNTTLDEEPFLGKLPETPLRAVIPASSYKVMCQIADDLRDKLCLIWNWLFPVLLKFIEVFFVGVIAAAIVLELLKLFYPSQEPKGMLQSSDIKDSALFVPLMLSHNEVTVKAREAENIL